MSVERRDIKMMGTSFRFLVLLLALYGLGIGAACAGERVWIGLYLAENAPPPPDAILAPEGLHHRLHEVFGFKHYELIQSDEVELRNEWEQWFVPRKDFFIRVEPMHHQPGEPRFIYYEIYQNGFILAHGKYQPQEDTPLFINGPDFHQGRFIFVLDAR